MADTTTELEVLDEIVDVLGGQSGQHDTVVPVLEDIRDLLGGVEKRPVQTFDTVASMQAATWLKSGMTCHTNGFNAAGDGGAAYYSIDTTGDIACAGSLYATQIATPESMLSTNVVFVDNANMDSVLFNSEQKTRTMFVLVEDLSITATKTIENMSYCVLTSNAKRKILAKNGGVTFSSCGYNIISNITFEGDVVVSGTPPFSYTWTAGTVAQLVKLYDSHRNYFDGCTFDKAQIDLVLETSYVNTFNNCLIRDAQNVGVFLTGSTYQPQVNFNNCFFNRNKTAGALIRTSEVYFYGCVFQFNGNHVFMNSSSLPLYNIGIQSCDLENSASHDIELAGTQSISNVIVENCTIANDSSNVVEIFGVASLTPAASRVEFRANHTSSKKICTDASKFDPTCYFDNTSFPLAYQMFMNCMGIFKTSTVKVPMYIQYTQREIVAPLIGKYLSGTITLVFTEAIGTVQIVNRGSNKVFATSDHITFTLDVNEPIEGIWVIDLLSSAPTARLSSALFAGTYKR